MDSLEIQKKLEAKRLITSDGHWLWTGGKFDHGYGFICVEGKVKQVHRVAFQIYKPEETTLSVNCVLHKPPCVTRNCFNPEHLYLGDKKQNALDCVLMGRHSELRKTHCDAGHAFDEENTLRRKDKPGRECRACRKVAKRRYYVTVEQPRRMAA